MSAFVHLELSTDDPKKARDFYKKLAGWKFSEMKIPGGGSYIGFNVPAGGPGGGIGAKMMPQQPTAWMPYLGVKSVKKTIAKAVSLGATIIIEYMPIGDMGALGIFTDPTGATIGLWEAAPPKKSAPKKKAAKKSAKKSAAKDAKLKAKKKDKKKK